jgi:hypothetical protein
MLRAGTSLQSVIFSTILRLCPRKENLATVSRNISRASSSSVAMLISSVSLGRLSVLACLITQCLGVCHGQQGPLPGIQPLQTLQGTSYDRVDLASGDVLVQIPVRAKLGKIPFTFELTGSFMDEMIRGNTGNYWGPTAGFGGIAPSSGLGTQLTYNVGKGSACGPTSATYSFFSVIDQNGVSHSVPGLGTTSCTTTPVIGQTTDGSGFTLAARGASLDT